MRIISLLILFILFSFSAHADPKKIKEEAQASAAANPYLQNFLTHEGAAQIQGIVGYEPGKAIKGEGISIEGAESLGNAQRNHVRGESENYQCNKERCEVGHTFSLPATVKRNELIEEAGFTKDADGNRNKGYLDKALKTIKNAQNEFDFINGGYKDCKADDEIITNNSIETCEQFYDMKQNSCFAKQVVEIDPKYTYLCNKKRDVKEKVCADVLKSLKCKQTSGDCDSGGIVLKSLAADMGWSYNYPTLTIGSTDQSYWHAVCDKFVRSTTFEIKNKSLIKELKIVKVGFDDYMRITVNGTQVYNQPYGGDILEIKNGWFVVKTKQQSDIQDNPGSSYFTKIRNGHSCELSTHHLYDIDIDLLPYLNEGMNEIKTEVVVARVGEGWMQIRTKQHCCSEWVEEREEQCDYL